MDSGLKPPGRRQKFRTTWAWLAATAARLLGLRVRAAEDAPVMLPTPQDNAAAGAGAAAAPAAEPAAAMVEAAPLEVGTLHISFEHAAGPMQLVHGVVAPDPAVPEPTPVRKTHVLSFINLKGGVGKTTTAIAVAEILAHEQDRRVLLIDLDPQTNATVTLITEDQWAELDRSGRTVAQLFEDYLNPQYPQKFDADAAITKHVSTVNQGIERLDLLASSIRLIDIQERIPMIAAAGHFTINPLDILNRALRSVLDRYDYVIIDCPPSLGTVTKNGLRISTGYIIPTIPDTLSTWGIYQIVDNVDRFARDTERAIPALGIVATKVQGNKLHARVIGDLKGRRLGRFGEAGRLVQPPVFDSIIPQSVAVARGADVLAGLRTLRLKYGDAYEPLQSLTQEIKTLCENSKP